MTMLVYGHIQVSNLTLEERIQEKIPSRRGLWLGRVVNTKLVWKEECGQKQRWPKKDSFGLVDPDDKGLCMCMPLFYLTPSTTHRHVIFQMSISSLELARIIAPI